MEARRPARRPGVYTLSNYLLTNPCPPLECGPLEISLLLALNILRNEPAQYQFVFPVPDT